MSTQAAHQIVDEMPEGPVKELWRWITTQKGDEAARQRAHYWRMKLIGMRSFAEVDQMMADMGIDPDACDHCGEHFERKRQTKQFCSTRCRVAAHRAKDV